MQKSKLAKGASLKPPRNQNKEPCFTPPNNVTDLFLWEFGVNILSFQSQLQSKLHFATSTLFIKLSMKTYVFVFNLPIRLAILKGAQYDNRLLVFN